LGMAGEDCICALASIALPVSAHAELRVGSVRRKQGCTALV
jgi:hypothetical protein